MSYDFTLFRPVPGVDPRSTYQELMQKEEEEIVNEDSEGKKPLPDSTRKEMQVLANVLNSKVPEFEQFLPAAPLPWIELNHQELQVQVSIGERTIAITLPYFRDKATNMMRLALDCVETLEGQGFVAYDPQLDRVVTANDIEVTLEQYRQVGKAARLAILGAGDKKKRWWKFW